MAIDRLLAPALLVVDVQAGTLPNSRAVGADELIGRTVELASAFGAAERPVYYVVSTGTAAGTTEYGSGGRRWPTGFDALDPRLPRRDGDPLLPRVGWSAFAGTDLEQRIAADAVRELVIVGLATTFGVESSARAAADLGLDVIVVADAVSDPDLTGHERTLTHVVPALGRVTTTSELAALLS